MALGKGKTEASVGCAIRAIANDEEVLFVQFLKNGHSSELKELDGKAKVMFSDVDKITLPQNATISDKFKAQSLFSLMTEEIRLGQYNLLVADELLPAIDMGLITIDQFSVLIDLCKEKEVDLFSTGRVRVKELRVKIAEMSDICSDVRCVTHCFNTHCNSCNNDYPYHYTYCPSCGSELSKSEKPKKGRDY